MGIIEYIIVGAIVLWALWYAWKHLYHEAQGKGCKNCSCSTAGPRLQDPAENKKKEDLKKQRFEV